MSIRSLSSALPEISRKRARRSETRECVCVRLPPHRGQFFPAFIMIVRLPRLKRGGHVVGDHEAGKMVFLDDLCRERQHLFCRAGVKRRSVLIEQAVASGDCSVAIMSVSACRCPPERSPTGWLHAVLKPHAEQRQHVRGSCFFSCFVSLCKPAALSGGKREVFLDASCRARCRAWGPERGGR